MDRRQFLKTIFGASLYYFLFPDILSAKVEDISQILDYLSRYQIRSLSDLDIDNLSKKIIEKERIKVRLITVNDVQRGDADLFGLRLSIGVKDRQEIVLKNYDINMKNFSFFVVGNLLFQLRLKDKNHHRKNSYLNMSKDFGNISYDDIDIEQFLSKYEKYLIQMFGINKDEIIQEMMRLYYIYNRFLNLYIRYEVPHEVGHCVFYKKIDTSDNLKNKLWKLFVARYRKENKVQSRLQQMVFPTVDILEQEGEGQDVLNMSDDIKAKVLSEYFAILYSTYTMGNIEEFYRKIKSDLQSFAKRLKIENSNNKLPINSIKLIDNLKNKVLNVNHIGKLYKEEKEFIKDILDEYI